MLTSMIYTSVLISFQFGALIMATPRKRNPQKPGRNTLYKKSMIKQTRDLVMMGYTHEKVAKFYNIHISSLYLWKTLHPDFSDALNICRDENDSNIVRSLYNVAKGYDYIEKKKETDGQGKVKTIRIKKHMPPNVGAIKVWLYNRRPKQFKPEAALSSQGSGEDLPAPPLIIQYDVNPPVKAVKITIGKDPCDHANGNGSNLDI